MPRCRPTRASHLLGAWRTCGGSQPRQSSGQQSGHGVAQALQALSHSLLWQPSGGRTSAEEAWLQPGICGLSLHILVPPCMRPRPLACPCRWQLFMEGGMRLPAVWSPVVVEVAWRVVGQFPGECHWPGRAGVWAHRSPALQLLVVSARELLRSRLAALLPDNSALRRPGRCKPLRGLALPPCSPLGAGPAPACSHARHQPRRSHGPAHSRLLAAAPLDGGRRHLSLHRPAAV